MTIINGIKFKDIPKFYGAIIEDGEIVGFGHFRSNGYWVGAGGKHITSYERLEDGQEIPDAQFSRQRVITDAGKALNFFYIESYDGEDFKAYVEGLKAQKEV